MPARGGSAFGRSNGELLNKASKNANADAY